MDDGGFFQDPPRLGNQYDDDALLRGFLARALPPDALRDVEPSLHRMGEAAAGRLLDLSRAHRREEPEHVPFDAWGPVSYTHLTLPTN